LHFNLINEGAAEVCKDPPYSEACQISSRWLEDVTVISNDLFIGRQFARPRHPPAEPTEQLPAEAISLQTNLTVRE
jgi:hypothetical protein